MMKKMRTMAALAATAACAACGGGASDRPDVARVDSASVEIVTSRGTASLDWSFEPELRLGGEDEGPASFYSVWEGNVAVDAAGNIHVLDANEHRVVVFSSTGEHLRTHGRKGGGPGELSFPTSVAVAQDGSVSVHDFGSPAGLIRWAADGTLLDPQPLREGGAAIMRFAHAGNDYLVTLRDLDRDRNLDITRLLHRTQSGDTTEIETLEQPMGAPVEFRSCTIRALMPPIFAPALLWSSHGTTVATSSGTQYEVRVREGAALRRIMRRDLPQLPATPELAARTLSDMTIRFGGGECRIPPDEQVAARGVASHVPAIARLRLAPDGSLWVERTSLEADATGAIDVFDTDGAYLGELAAGLPFPVAFMPDGRILAIEKDDLDIERIVVYRVRR